MKKVLIFLALVITSGSALAFSKNMYPYEKPEGRQGDALHCIRAEKGMDLELGKWYTNFAVCKDYADEHGLPMVAIWSNSGSINCWYTDVCFTQQAFLDWKAINPAGQVIYCFMAGGHDDIDQELGTSYNWMRYEGGNTLNAYPFVAFWWKAKGINEHLVGDALIGAKYSYELADKNIPLFTERVIAKMESVFAGYCAPVVTAPAGTDKVVIHLIKGVVYHVDGMANCENLKPIVGLSDGLYLAMESGDFEATVTEKGGTLTYQICKPGVVGFVNAEQTVSESVCGITGEEGPMKITLKRKGGTLGKIEVKVAEKNSSLQQYRYSFDEQTITWEDGDAEDKTVEITIYDDLLYEGKGVIELEATIVKSEFDGARVDGSNGVLTLTVVDDDAAPVGRSENPLEITIFDKEQKFAEQFTDDNSFYFETTLVGGCKYFVRVEGGTENVPYNLIVNSEDMFEQSEDANYYTSSNDAWIISSNLGGRYVFKVMGGAECSDFVLVCSAITAITIPDGVTSIEDGAFEGCDWITSVTIPSSVTSIGAGAFNGCSGLKEFVVDLGDVVRIKGLLDECGFDFSNSTFVERVTDGGPYTEVVDGIEWTFFINNGEAELYNGYYPVIPDSTAGAITIPSKLGNCPVTSIGGSAFAGCSALTSVTIPSSVTSIGWDAFKGCNAITSVTIPACVTSLSNTFPDAYTTIENVVICDGTTSIWDMFYDCRGLKTVTIPESVTRIGDMAFSGCGALTSVTIPESVTRIGDRAFYDCSNLSSIEFKGDAPDFGMEVFSGTPKRLVISVAEGTIGWDGGISSELPETFKGRAIVHSGSHYEWKGGGEQTTPIGGVTSVALTTTNVVVHYVLNGIVPETVTPTIDNALVAIYTEVKGDAVAIPQSWAEQFPQFEEKFGTDFVKALTMETGKKGAGGAPMLVWHGFVAGTDPTNPEDTFKASITFDKETGKPIISWMPEVKDESGKYLRKYTVYGKAKLTDEQWEVVPEGREDDYNFFKVTVEML